MNDGVTISFTAEEVRHVVKELRELKENPERHGNPINSKPGLEWRDSAGWNLNEALKDVFDNRNDDDLVKSFLYRPFDTRWTWYSGHQGFMSRPRAGCKTS